MSVLPHDPGPGDEGTPRWVKMFAIAAGVLLLLFLVMMLSGGEHGPGRHMRSGGAGTGTAPAGGPR